MRRRIFIVLWICWCAFILLPVGAAGVYVRFTNGFDVEFMLLTAGLIWAPFFALLALQYVVVGHPSLVKLWLDN